jgi:hypothetical protein
MEKERGITIINKDKKKQCDINIVVSFLKRLKSKYTMTYSRSLFRDTVSGRMVNEYTDCYGYLFMANSRLGWRMKKK